MAERISDLLRDQGRGIIGGLVLGLPLLYTMETWWLAWTLPVLTLALFAFGGLVAIFAAVTFIGFRPEHEDRFRFGEMVQDFAELVLQAVLATFVVLFLFGLIGRGEPLGEIVRLGLIEIVPVGFGAALANEMLRGTDEDDEATFGREMAIFAVGAVFFAFPVAPTEEMEMIASQMGWGRVLGLLAASFVVTYLALYEVHFRGSKGRGERLRGFHLRLGETCAGCVLALLVSALLLAAYGHLPTLTAEEAVQQVVILGHLGALGGSAARVVI